MSRVLLLSAAAIAACDAFAPSPAPPGAVSRLPGASVTTALPLCSRPPPASSPSLSMQAESRRDALAIAGAALLGLATPPPPATASAPAAPAATAATAAKAAGQAAPPLQGPVSVIGAGGGNLGSELVASLVRREIDVRPVFRTPRTLPIMPKGGASSSVLADVTKAQTLGPAVQGASAVVFSVSPKRKSTETADGTESEIGTNSKEAPMDVFNTGLANVAKACVKYNVPRLIVISRSGCSNPSQSGSEICGAELLGEEAVKDIYREANAGRPDGSRLSYTIARAGVLMSGMRRGPKEVELNQGDTLSGHISRPDMADLVTDMIASGKGEMATFEAFYQDTANPTNFMQALDDCLASGRSFKQCNFGDDFTEVPNISEVISGKVKVGKMDMTMGIKGLKGDSWMAMLDGLKKDAAIDMAIEEFGVQRG